MLCYTLMKKLVNQDSPLVDEQSGECTMGHIVFRDGTLRTTKDQVNLQKLLSLYHPLKGRIYDEFQPKVVA